MARTRLAAASRYRDTQLVTEITTRKRLRVRPDILDATFRYHLTAESSRSRPKVDNVIRGLNGLLVMFNDDDGVTQVSEAPQRCK